MTESFAAPAAGAPGWRSDPWYAGQYRWWDGTGWTADVFPVGVRGEAAGVVTERPRAERPAEPAPVRRAVPAPPPPVWAIDRPEEPAREFIQPAWTEPSPSPSRLNTKVVVALLLAVGFVLGAGIEVLADGKSSPHDTAAAPTQPTLRPAPSAPATPSAPSTPASPPPSAPPRTAVLQRLGLRPADLPADQLLELVPGGTNTSTEPTLDLCNGTFASEHRRVARLQVVALTAVGDAAASTEAVLYDSPAATVQAFAELRHVAASCPSGPVASPVGEPTVRTSFGPQPDRGWPDVAGVQRLAYRINTTDASGQRDASTVVYLRRGKALVGLYLPHTAGGGLRASVAGRTSAAGIAALIEHRLARAPAAAVGA